MEDNDFFDLSIYRQKYSDLAHLTDAQLEAHWLNHGKSEGRNCYGISRNDFLLSGIERDQLGLEIAPYFNPLLPKVSGYSVKVLDIFDETKLRQLASENPEIPSELISCIEEVDFVGSASSLLDVISTKLEQGSLSYIISSHNFEHLPNPIKFLKESSYYLSDGGTLRMAIPDLRCCFDFHQWPTSLAEWLQAYQDNKAKPTPFDVFRQKYLSVNNFGYIKYPKTSIKIVNKLDRIYSEYLSAINEVCEDYEDIHCSFFVPASFELLIVELRFLGLIDLKISSISGPHGNEFWVILAKEKANDSEILKDKIDNIRKSLLLKINSQISEKNQNLEEVISLKNGHSGSCSHSKNDATILSFFKFIRRFI